MLTTACTGLAPSLDDAVVPPVSARESMQALVAVGSEVAVPFVADEVVASLTGRGGREELVVSGISADRTRSLAFVLDVGALSFGESADLSHHGAVYMEAGPAGGDWLFDGTPQGALNWEGELEPGRDLSAVFQVYIPTWDRDGEGPSEAGVSLEGTFSVRLLEDRR